MICGIVAAQDQRISSLLVISHSAAPFVRALSTTNYTTYTSPVTLPASSPATGAFSAGGEWFACSNGTAAEKFFIYQTGLSTDAATWTKLSAPATMPSAALVCMAFSPDGQYLAVGGNITNDFIIYKTSDWSVLATRDVSPGSNVRSLDFSPDGSRLVVTTQTGYLTLYDIPGVTKVTGLPSVSLDAKSVRHSPDGTEIVSGIGSPYESPYLKRYASGTLVAGADLPSASSFPSNDDNIQFSANGRWLITVPAQGVRMASIYDWQAKTLAGTLPSLTGVAGLLKGLSISIDSQYVAITQSNDTTEPTLAVIRISDAQTVFTSEVSNTNPSVARYSPF